MSGFSPNSQNIDRVASGIANSTGIFVHPEYRYWRLEWRKLRDVLAGQREVKRASVTYLRKMKGMDDEDYADYLDGATFYNMTGQTLNGMVGQVFRRNPLIIGLPKKFKDMVRAGFGKDGSGHINVSKTVITEQVSMGRFGVLVDAPSTPSTTPTSFTVGYAAENILDWTVEEVGGFYMPTRILLREFVRDSGSKSSDDNPWLDKPSTIATRGKSRNQPVVQPVRYFDAYAYATIYRELLIEVQKDGSRIYVQNVYREDPNGTPMQRFVPNVRGLPLDFIPFVFFGAMGNNPDVEKPPLLDIADLNISHYRTYACLEHGRAYTALPVYYAPGKDDQGAAEYHIGPNLVWEVPSGETPGILEYKGEGLRALESALSTKEKQIAAIGGRLMAGSSQGSENANQTQLREANEQALVLHVIQAAEPGMAQIVRWWLMWRDVPLSASINLEYVLNRDFLSGETGAREIRALQMLHEDGYVPIDILYNVLIKVEWLDATTTVEEFKLMLEDPASFPNNPDAQSRQRGYVSRQQELDQSTIAREAEMQQAEIDLQEREVVMMENAPPPLPPTVPAPAGAPRPSSPGPKRPAMKVRKPK